MINTSEEKIRNRCSVVVGLASARLFLYHKSIA